jgi:hypothetical protein
MITLHSSRQSVETAKTCFFPYINAYKQTRLNNLVGTTITSEEYLSALVLNCLLTEVEKLIERKLIMTSGQKMKFEFSDAQGVVLYKSLLALPLSADNIYLDRVRNEWIERLDQQIISNNLYQANRPNKIGTGEHVWTDYFEDL